MSNEGREARASAMSLGASELWVGSRAHALASARAAQVACSCDELNALVERMVWV